MKTRFNAAALLLLASCTSTQMMTHADRDISSVASVNWVKEVRKNVYEVVIPKFEDTDIRYDRALPLEKLSYRERNDKFVSLGTAFSIEDNKFLSAAHVFNLQTKSLNKVFYIRDIEGNVYKINRILKYSIGHDVIEFDLETPSKFSSTLKLGKKPEMGESVYTVGNAQGEGISVRGGQIASFTPEQQDGRWDYLRFSAPASPGNSGGPLLNRKGEVVGIVTMKNASENLNYALPIEEAEKLSHEQALFQVKSIPISLGGKTATGVLDFSVPLPAPIVQFSEASETKMRGFFKNLLGNFVGEHEKNFFPYGEKSQTYLRNQSYSSFINAIEANGAGGWGFKNSNYQTVSLGNDRSFSYYAHDTSMSFIVPKPQDRSLKEFLNNPELIMDVILGSLQVTRPVGDEKVRILSYGKTQDAYVTHDKLARPWVVGIWRHHFSFRTAILSCTPIPTGAACDMLEIPTATEIIEPADTMMEFNHQNALSYYGSFKQWQEFLALDKNILPVPFREASFQFVPGKQLSYKLGGMTNLLYPGNVFNADSLLSVNMGMTTAVPYRQEIHGVTLKPRTDKVTKLHTSVMFKPSPDMNLDFQNRWKDMLAKKNPFDGKTFIRDNSKMVMVPRVPTERAVAAEFNGNKLYLTACTGELSVSDAAVQTMCANYQKNLKLGH